MCCPKTSALSVWLWISTSLWCLDPSNQETHQASRGDRREGGERSTGWEWKINFLYQRHWCSYQSPFLLWQEHKAVLFLHMNQETYCRCATSSMFTVIMTSWGESDAVSGVGEGGWYWLWRTLDFCSVVVFPFLSQTYTGYCILRTTFERLSAMLTL